MSLRRSTVPWPGPGRLTLVLLAVVPAVMAYPWSSVRERWVLGVAVLLAAVLLGWWRGLHLTTLLGRRLAMLRRHRRAPNRPRSGPDVATTVVLRVAPSTAEVAPLPVSLIAGYLDRYGLRADTVRITSRDTGSGAQEPTRDTWIGLTYSAARNLAALRARSARIPLRETAEVAARRLADHLREIGWEAATAGAAEIPDLFDVTARETWRGVCDGAADCVAAYQVGVDDGLADTLADIWAHDGREIWTAVEIAETTDHRTIAAGCAIRGAGSTAVGAPAGLTPEHGRHRAALQVLHPLSVQRLPGHTELPAAIVAELRWPVAASGAAVTSGRRPYARHAAAN